MDEETPPKYLDARTKRITVVGVCSTFNEESVFDIVNVSKEHYHDGGTDGEWMQRFKIAGFKEIEVSVENFELKIDAHYKSVVNRDFDEHRCLRHVDIPPYVAANNITANTIGDILEIKGLTRWEYTFHVNLTSDRGRLDCASTSGNDMNEETRPKYLDAHTKRITVVGREEDEQQND